ncbi:hypothetical protein [Desmospora profundinema]|uniref:Uncharacterized protein n=1 Tax=Desmospora profundinema TaxID=1571184 RepID=A0ABU1IMP4_9BACL|nr:hypothetical protein [Desmospora profundinema]MDR6226048.1 hypothetical protein [Desmospora profundinema]
MSEDKRFIREEHNDHLVQETRSLPKAPPVKQRKRMRAVEEGLTKGGDEPRSYSDELKRL